MIAWILVSWAQHSAFNQDRLIMSLECAFIAVGGYLHVKVKKEKNKNPPKRKHKTTVCVFLFSQTCLPFSVELYCWTLSIVMSSLHGKCWPDAVDLGRAGRWDDFSTRAASLGSQPAHPICLLWGTHAARSPLPLPHHPGCSAFLPTSEVFQISEVRRLLQHYKWQYISELCASGRCPFCPKLLNSKKFLGCFSPCVRLLKAAEVCLDLDDAMSSLSPGTMVLESHTSPAIPLYRAGCENRSAFRSFPFQGKYCLHPEIFPFLVRNFCVHCKQFTICFCSSTHSRTPLWVGNIAMVRHIIVVFHSLILVSLSAFF